MVRFAVTLRLPFVDIAVQDISDLLPKRQGTAVAGPFLIIERSHGLALESDSRAQMGWKPCLKTVHGSVDQQWGFRRVAGSNDEYVILSLANGMALDATFEPENHRNVLVWEEHAEPWQRWTLQRTPDSLGFQIKTCHVGHRSIDVGQAPGVGDSVWLWDSHGLAHQTFLIVPVNRVASRNLSSKRASG
ncbi:MAG: RICIN domain-containing protein [Bifidobacteriaceae bacterium]|jgi:hypothetical protein|nr:RICIN domain-containing protein [Bifidobacteriaceae bacterium]